MATSVPTQFSGGIRSFLNRQPGQKPLEEDIADDLEGERETIPNLTAGDLDDLKEQNPGPFASTWRASIASASKGVTDQTDNEYQR